MFAIVGDSSGVVSEHFTTNAFSLIVIRHRQRPPSNFWSYRCRQLNNSFDARPPIEDLSLLDGDNIKCPPHLYGGRMMRTLCQSSHACNPCLPQTGSSITMY